MREESPAQNPNGEKGTIKLTMQEIRQYADLLPIDEMAVFRWMKDKGIEFDSGDIDVEVDGTRRKMSTFIKDFGTLSLTPEEERLRDGQ